MMPTLQPPVLRKMTGPGIALVQYEEDSTSIYLIALKLKPDCQGRGIGKQILNDLKRLRKRIRLLPVADDPERQQDLERFYARNGFVQEDYEEYLTWNP